MMQGLSPSNKRLIYAVISLVLGVFLFYYYISC